VKIIVRSQSELPIYAQIAQQIREQILSGQIPEGTVLPSIRALAREIGVSVITTTRAYGDLEKEGYIASRQGRGTVVLSRDNDLLREQYLKRIEDGLSAAIGTARAIGMDKEDVKAVLDALWNEDGEERN
jgi:GntR family transcriptional regulator